MKLLKKIMHVTTQKPVGTLNESKDFDKVNGTVEFKIGIGLTSVTFWL